MIKYLCTFLMIIACANVNAQSVPITNGLVAHFDSAGMNYVNNGTIATWTDNVSSIQAIMTNQSMAPDTVHTNGHVGLVFNTNEYLATSLISDFQSNQPTIIIVKRGPVSGYIYSTVASLSTGSANNDYFVGDRAAFFSNSSGNFIYKSHVCANNNLEREKGHEFFITAASYSEVKDNFDYYLNGVKSTYNYNYAGTTNNQPIINRRLGIGYRVDWYINEKYNGEIYEVLVYNYKLSDAEMEQVTNYLICKYNITGTFCGKTLNCEKTEDPNDDDPKDEDPNDNEDPDNPKSIKNLDHTTIFELFPNPTTGILNINNKTNNVLNLSVLDITGRNYMNSTINKDSTIDISKLPQGTYLLKIGNQEIGYYYKKVVLQ